MIQAVVFDIGGILEIVPDGGDPTKNYPELIARWENLLHKQPGEVRARITGVNERLQSMGKDVGIGTCTEEEWQEEIRQALDLTHEQVAVFVREFWDIYLGNPNTELMAFFGNLRPRYQTALLSNSGSGARREEENRYHFSQISDFIIYSHEVGIEKPDPRIYALTCERLGRHPDEVVFLDDAESNVIAAQAFGIHAILFKDTAQAISDIEVCLSQHE